MHYNFKQLGISGMHDLHDSQT